MAEFTSSPQVSPTPNQLFQPLLAGQQQAQQNQLQMQQIDLSAADHEQVGRLAAGLLNEPDLGKRADLYSRGVGMLQSQGLAKYAPPTLPDESTLRSLVSQTVPAQTQAEWLQNLTANKAYTNAGNTASTAAPGTTTGAAPPASGGFGAQLAQSESGGKSNVINQQGYTGTYQFGKQRLADLGYYTPAPGEDMKNNTTWAGKVSVPGFNVTDQQSFAANPAAQQAVFNTHLGNIDQAIAATPGASRFDPNGLRAVAHLGGIEGMQKFVASGGAFSPSDANGTSLVAYYNKFSGGAPGAATTASAAPAGGGGTPGSYQVASTAPAAPPGSTAAPGAPTAAAPAPGATTAAAPTQPQATPAGGPAPPQLQPLNANGLTPVQQRQIDALAANPQNKQPVIVAQQQAFQNQNIALAQKAFSDYVQLQQLEVSKGTLTNSQAETNLKYWQAQHPELAPNARVQTLAYRTLQELAPVVRQGNATQDVIDKYNNAATEYQEFKEVTDPVTKQLKSVPTRPLPPGFPEPTGTGASGGVRTLTEGLSPAQQQVERDPAAYKVSESQYDRDSKEIAAIGDAGRQSQADQVRVKEMQDVLQKFNSGRGTDAATAAAAWFNSWAPAGLTGWQKESANLSGSQAAEAFSKLALVGAGTQERGVLGARGGYQAIKLFKEANPNINLQDATNKSILDMQLISNQANADYSQAALSHFADNEKKFSATHQYDSLAQFDRNWNGQRNPQVYAAAMGAIAGQPPSQWTKGLSDDEYARALQIVQRAKPSAVVQTKNGPYSMQPNAVTTGTSAAPGTKVIRFDHNGNQIQ